MWVKSPEEDAFYGRMFAIADAEKLRQVQGKAAVDFFTKSGLPPAVLKQVWNLASSKMQPYLERDEFDVALGLIALAQKGEPLDLGALAAAGRARQLPLPVFQLADMFVMTSNDEDKYATIFRTAADGGVLSPVAAMDLFQKSGLSLADVQTIYKLVDPTLSVPLRLQDFTIIMHVIVCKSRRGLPQLPTAVPREWFPTFFSSALPSLEGLPSADAMLQAQVEVQSKLQAALTSVPTVPLPSAAALVAPLQALGYHFPDSALALSTPALRELEGVLSTYIQEVKRDLASPASSGVPLATLVQTLSNLKQQSTRLLEQKDALQGRRPAELHVDTFGTVPAWGAFEAAPAPSVVPPSDANVDPFGFDLMGGTGGSQTATPAKPAVVAAVPVVVEKPVLDAFASATSSTFSAFDAMNDMDWGFATDNNAEEARPEASPEDEPPVLKPVPKLDNNRSAKAAAFSAFDSPSFGAAKTPAADATFGAFPASETKDFGAFSEPATSFGAFDAPAASGGNDFPATTAFEFDAFPQADTGFSDFAAAAPASFDAFPVSNSGTTASFDAFPASDSSFDAFPASDPSFDAFPAFDAAPASGLDAFPVPEASVVGGFDASPPSDTPLQALDSSVAPAGGVVDTVAAFDAPPGTSSDAFMIADAPSAVSFEAFPAFDEQAAGSVDTPATSSFEVLASSDAPTTGTLEPVAATDAPPAATFDAFPASNVLTAVDFNAFPAPSAPSATSFDAFPGAEAPSATAFDAFPTSEAPPAAAFDTFSATEAPSTGSFGAFPAPGTLSAATSDASPDFEESSTVSFDATNDRRANTHLVYSIFCRAAAVDVPVAFEQPPSAGPTESANIAIPPALPTTGDDAASDRDGSFVLVASPSAPAVVVAADDCGCFCLPSDDDPFGSFVPTSTGTATAAAPTTDDIFGDFQFATAPVPPVAPPQEATFASLPANPADEVFGDFADFASATTAANWASFSPPATAPTSDWASFSPPATAPTATDDFTF
ncbi:hypothetical protein ACHHYP_13792 [Achlya hypogyna]|uniref:EH domain-containing protein n=1 Tax=Achlya hypogyna TaxID=1202772 RepID=A0A1V9YEP4_ACHHY|nr:hypothetical protein ACHHYP_13792 [Achlya hypogyna]